jgi:hypothetical protein
MHWVLERTDRCEKSMDKVLTLKTSDDAHPHYLTVSLYRSPSSPLSIRNVTWYDASAATYSEEEIVPGLNLPSKTHEKARVDAHGNLPARSRAKKMNLSSRGSLHFDYLKGGTSRAGGKRWKEEEKEEGMDGWMDGWREGGKKGEKEKERDVLQAGCMR